ncbi:Acetoacetyl-CoA synthetase [Pteropus alecto]|uniref:Acetoacetyl-CoA synthetase n=1 Tax=Pteropus alecto TaxID=9402 RepID=L5KS66_PTEAL|nr:Acetoacetyl-CoA synthetase [Pteropus alecto]
MSKELQARQDEILECRVMWEPDSKRNTEMDRFRAAVSAARGLSLQNYNDLYRWSIESYSDFWAEFWKFSRIVYSRMYDEVVDPSKGIADVPEWFRGSRLNYAENLLRHGEDGRVALYVVLEQTCIFVRIPCVSVTFPRARTPNPHLNRREDKEEIVKVTFEELRQQVALFAAAMRKMGVEKGDRVVGYLPNGEHAVEAMLAAASIGAIWSSMSPDFGVTGVLDRCSQIRPKLIFSVEAVVFNGKEHSHLDKVQQVTKGLSDLKKVVVIPYVTSRDKIDISKIPNSVFLDDFLAAGRGDRAPQLEFTQLPFNHPLFILFSSGTTGVPKCLVHSAGGTLIQHLKEHSLHGNMTSSDIILFYTTVGWMVWNWILSTLAMGMAVVLYDGSVLKPTLNVLWDLVDRIGVTILGTSPTWLSMLERKNLKPVETHDLRSLRMVMSTGSPLLAQGYEYVYRCIKRNVFLTSVLGGTDIISAFMGQNPTLPVYKGEIQGPNLGMAVEVWNEEGVPSHSACGRCWINRLQRPTTCGRSHWKGRSPHSSLASVACVWAQSDYCRINPKTGGIVVLGRSDGMLNPKGVRFGSSEIYNIVEAFEEVMDSLCVSQYNKDREERVVLFLKMASGHSFQPDLVRRVQNAIRIGLSARHVPSVILETKDIPYTLTGKKVEVAVKQAISGKPVENRVGLLNPETLDWYRHVPELQDF